MFDSIYLDMDGPLACFHLEAVRAHLRAGRRIKGLDHPGTPLELSVQALMAQWPKGVACHQFICPHVEEKENYWSEKMDDFWKPIRSDPMFWQSVPPMPWLKELLTLCQEHCEHLVICTSPDLSPSSYGGKYRWMETQKLTHLEFITCRRKWRLADPNCLLIDDFEVHINSWNERCQAKFQTPGHAILFPCVWNEDHQHAFNPIPYIERQIHNHLTKVEATADL